MTGKLITTYGPAAASAAGILFNGALAAKDGVRACKLNKNLHEFQREAELAQDDRTRELAEEAGKYSKEQINASGLDAVTDGMGVLSSSLAFAAELLKISKDKVSQRVLDGSTLAGTCGYVVTGGAEVYKAFSRGKASENARQASRDPEREGAAGVNKIEEFRNGGKCSCALLRAFGALGGLAFGPGVPTTTAVVTAVAEGVIDWYSDGQIEKERTRERAQDIELGIQQPAVSVSNERQIELGIQQPAVSVSHERQIELGIQQPAVSVSHERQIELGIQQPAVSVSHERQIELGIQQPAVSVSHEQQIELVIQQPAVSVSHEQQIEQEQQQIELVIQQPAVSVSHEQQQIRVLDPEIRKIHILEAQLLNHPSSLDAEKIRKFDELHMKRKIKSRSASPVGSRSASPAGSRPGSPAGSRPGSPSPVSLSSALSPRSVSPVGSRPVSPEGFGFPSSLSSSSPIALEGCVTIAQSIGSGLPVHQNKNP